MAPFEMWGESFKFALVYAFIIIVPCVLVILMGKKMIERLGRYPSKAPIIQMSVFWQFVVLEVITFFCLIAFYQFFAGNAGK